MDIEQAMARFWDAEGGNEAGVTAALKAVHEAMVNATALIERMSEALLECEGYFDQRADADHDDTGFVPNKEMRLLTVVRSALGAA